MTSCRYVLRADCAACPAVPEDAPAPSIKTRRAVMQVVNPTAEAKRYAKTVEVSKRIRWDIDRDVIKGRDFDFTKKFLPDGLSKAPTFGFLSPAELRILSQIQGRTYANMFGLVERFIGAKILE